MNSYDDTVTGIVGSEKSLNKDTILQKKNSENSDWLTSDLHQLQQNDISKQLEAIFGEEEACQFLNPTIEDKSNKLILQPIVTKHASQGAHTLWNSLRSTSKKKLASQTSSKAQTDYIEQNMGTNFNSLRRVELYRQQFELMHKIAHFNEAKTRELVNTVKLPFITADIETMSPRRSRRKDYNKDEREVSEVKTLINNNNNSSNNNNDALTHRYIISPPKSNKLIKFVSEKECTVTGRFRDRMKQLGIDSNVGISNSQLLYRGPWNTTDTKFRKTNEKIHQKANKKKPPMTKSYSWQPLTLNALTEYTTLIQAPGAGMFNNGRTNLWKPDLNIAESVTSNCES